MILPSQITSIDSVGMASTTQNNTISSASIGRRIYAASNDGEIGWFCGVGAYAHS